MIEYRTLKSAAWRILLRRAASLLAIGFCWSLAAQGSDDELDALLDGLEARAQSASVAGEAQKSEQDAVSAPADPPSAQPAAAAQAPAVSGVGDPEDGEAAAASATLDTVPVEPLKPSTESVVKSKPTLRRVDEIVVTAQKREERLQDIPIAVTVIDGEQMQSQNISDVSDLTRAVPSLEQNGPPGNYNSKVSIRGLSTESYSRTAEQAVSYVLDGVVIGRAPTTTLFDINRVEVLRGPQGTLFGKNASAGVISVTTNAPDPVQFSASARADFGSEYGYRLLQGAINVPLGDTVALRLNGGQTYYTGFVRNGHTGEDNEQDSKGGRARILWEPTENLSFNLIADYEQQYVTEQFWLLFERYKDPETGEDLELPDCGGAFASPENLTSCNGDPTFADRKAYGYSGQLDLRVGEYDFTSISAIRYYKEDQDSDIDALPGDFFRNGNRYDNRVITQELRVASPAGEDFTWVAGLYYFDQRIDNTLRQFIGADGALGVATGLLDVNLCSNIDLCLGELVRLEQPAVYTATTKSYAGFGEATYSLRDDWRIIAGGRYTYDDVYLIGNQQTFLGSEVPLLNTITHLLPGLLSTDLEDRARVSNFSYRLATQFDVTDDVMTYFTFSKGYKGPQIIFVPQLLLPINGGTGEPQQPHPAYSDVVDPEYPTAYELGIKSALFGGAFVINADVFYTAVKGYQSSQFNDNGEFIPINISEIVTQGVELDVFGFLSQNWFVNFGGTYNKAYYPDGYLWPCTQVSERCAAVGDFEDIGGEQLQLTPRVKLNLASQFEYPLFGSITAFVSGDIVYRSKVRSSPNFDTRTNIPERTVIGARIGLRGNEGSWEVSVFGRNLTNERNPTFLIAPFLVSELSAPDKDTSGHILTTESFRFFGLSASVRF